MADRNYADRLAILKRIALELEPIAGGFVDWRWLVWDQPLRAWVYPVRGLLTDEADGFRWRRCSRVYIYWSQRKHWYASEVSETCRSFDLRFYPERQQGDDEASRRRDRLQKLEAQERREALDANGGPEAAAARRAIPF